MGLFTEKAKDYASEKARSAAHKVRKVGSIEVSDADGAKIRAMGKLDKTRKKIERDLRNAKKRKDSEGIAHAEALLKENKARGDRIVNRKTGGSF